MLTVCFSQLGLKVTFEFAGAEIDRSNEGGGPCQLRIKGGIYQRIGPLLPVEGVQPKFAQLYICDNELENRQAIFSNLDPNILTSLQHTLHNCNPYIQHFKNFASRADADDMELRLLESGKSA